MKRLNEREIALGANLLYIAVFCAGLYQAPKETMLELLCLSIYAFGTYIIRRLRASSVRRA